MERTKIDKIGLKTALRCYNRLSEKAKPQINDFLIKSAVAEMARKRRFIERCKSRDIKIFAYWLGNTEINTPTTADTAKHFNLPLPDVQNIIAQYVNALTAEICTDLQNGDLELLPYLETKKQQRIKDTAILHQYGLKRPTPLKLPQSVLKGFENAGITPPKCPKHKTKTSRTAKLYYWLNECLKSVQQCIFNAPHIERSTLDKLETTIKNEMDLSKLIENE